MPKGRHVSPRSLLVNISRAVLAYMRLACVGAIVTE